MRTDARLHPSDTGRNNKEKKTGQISAKVSIGMANHVDKDEPEQDG